MRRFGLLIFLVGCSSSGPSLLPDGSTSFAYSATLRWTTAAMPDITAVTIDGNALPSDETYLVTESYSSYQAALALSVQHPVVVTTATETLTFELQMLSWPCMNWMTDATKQAEQFSLMKDFNGRLSLDAVTGSCELSDGRVLQWAE